MRSHIQSTKQYVALLLVAVVLLNVAFASTAVAEPRIWVGHADLERDSTLVGESVGVEVQLHNDGDGGAIGVDITANGTVVESKRIQVDKNSEKTETIPITLDKPGRYKIRADGKTAGRLTVSRMRVVDASDRSDGQTMLLRAGTVEAGTSLTAALPETKNQSFTIEQVTMTGPGTPFNRTVSTYTPADSAPFSVPSDDSSTVLGAVAMDSISGVNTTSMLVTLDRETIREANLQTDDVTVYRKTDAGYVPVSTDLVTTGTNREVYQATTNGGSEFVIGSLAPAFEIRSEQLSAGSTADGKRIDLTATIANEGPVAGNYTAEMRVDGRAVDEQTVTVRSGEVTTITLQHTVTNQGDYQVSLGNKSVGSVVLTGDSASTGGDTSAETTGTQTDSDDSLLGARPSLPSLDDIGMTELGIGAGIVIIGGGLLLLARR